MLDKNKVCFILCVNDDLEYRECLLYLSRLNVPKGITVDILEIRDAISMTSGYQDGMEASDAKYKIYMHQDTRIVNKHFISNLITIFERNQNIGMLGMVGSPILPVDGVMWHDLRVGGIGWPINGYNGDICDGSCEIVEAIDGLLMATQVDINWRTDLFAGWDFYDISQSFEFRRAGYQVGVPKGSWDWVIHEDKMSLPLWDYDKHRRIFVEHYLNKCKRQ